MTELRLKGEKQHIADIPREEMARLLKSEQVDAVLKYNLADRSEPGAEEKGATVKVEHGSLVKGRPTASSVITTTDVDRDGDIVRADGLDVSHYVKNPVVLPMHTHTFPIGFTESLSSTKSAWRAKWQWAVDLPDSEAEKYMAWWDAFGLNTTSIGFIPTEWEPVKDGFGWDFSRSELLEFSVVVIPSNRGASRGVGAPNEHMARAMMDAVGEYAMSGVSPVVKGLWVAGESNERPKQVAGGIVKAEDCAVISTETVLPVTDPAPDGIVIDANSIATNTISADGIRAGTIDVTAWATDGDTVSITDVTAGDLFVGSDGASTHAVLEDSYDSIEQVRLACAAGVLPVERAFEIAERLVKGAEEARDAATEEAAQWKNECLELSALVLLRG